MVLIVAGAGAVLVAAPPGGPPQPIPRAGWLDDDRRGQVGDLVARQRDHPGWRGPLAAFSDRGHGEEGQGEDGQGEDGQGGPPVPGGPGADLVLIQPG